MTLYHTPSDIELPENFEACPPDAVGLIEEYHLGLHKVIVSKEYRRGSYTPIGTIICQENGDRKATPDASPDEIGEYVMSLIQYEIDKNDTPGKYKMRVVGPAGKWRFDRAKHIDMRHEDGQARTVSMMSDAELVEQQGTYIAELHQQILTMTEMVTASHKQVTTENREMMKIVSESIRKNAELERDRMRHTIELKMHEDEIRIKEAEAEASMTKFKEGISVFKETGAADEFIRVVARKVEGFGKKAPDVEVTEIVDAIETSTKSGGDSDKAPKDAVHKKKTTKKKSSKKKSSKKKSAKIRRKSDEVPSDDDSEEDAVMEEGRREIAEMAKKKPLVMAAEALKMSIGANDQWSIVRKTLSVEQADLLDDVFASETDEDVVAAAAKLYGAKGLQNLSDLSDHLDDQQKRFIGFIISRIPEC
jgi:hypothetical protein